MPYYREYFSNFSRSQAQGVGTEYPMVYEDAVLQGFRSRGSKAAVSSIEIADIVADPYAYYLQSTTAREYRARLAERGLPEEGEADRGHAFSLSKYHLNKSTSFSPTRVNKPSGSGESSLNYIEPMFFPDLTQLGIAGQSAPFKARANPTSTLDTFAQRAYSKTAPTATVFDAAQFLGELREGLPTLGSKALRFQSKAYKDLGSDYLNVQFGWIPFLNDLRNIGKALQGHTESFASMGHRVHRSWGTPTVSTIDKEIFNPSSTSLTNWLGYPGLRETIFGLPTGPIGNGVAPNGSFYFKRTTERTQWFEGEFTHFMPLNFDPSNYLAKLDQLINVKITPQTLWELAPWSWLVDWNLRIGDSIDANLKAANNKLIMHYGYAMEHTILKDVGYVNFTGNLSAKPAGNPSTYTYWNNLPASITYDATTVHKRRIRANPYGFKTGGTSALNSSQLAILGALGLTRLK